MSWFSSLTIYYQALLVYIIAINIIAFFTYGIDKSKSRQNLRRISEKTLWLLALIGGSLGSLLAMKLFRHKTKKLSFQVVMALILAIHIIIMVALFSK